MLVADVGARVMPVRKIIGATIEVTTQVRMANPNPNANANPSPSPALTLTQPYP